MNKVSLPCYGITVSWNPDTLAGDITVGKELSGSGFDGIASMVLAHAIAGIDIESPAYIEGIETAVDAVSNNS